MSLVADERAVGSSEGDRAITADRQETKYLIDAPRLGELARALRDNVAPHRFTGAGANRLPDAHHYSTTIYFDTPSRALLRAAREDPEHNLKVRAREYYDMHSSLAELATELDQIVHYRPTLWLELKQRRGDRTTKQRLSLEKARVPELLRGMPQREGEQGGEEAAIASFCAGLGEPLEASCLVNYRRIALQDPTGELRITLDLELAFYAPPADLWTRRTALVRGTFGTPRGVESGCLVEVKRRGALPAWLERALERAQAKPERFSKFLRAGEALYGRG